MTTTTAAKRSKQKYFPEDEEQPKLYNLEAEKAVLGSALIDPDSAVRLPLLLQPSDYWSESNRAIHETIVELTARRMPPDIILVMDELTRSGKANLVRDGVIYIIDIINKTPTSLYIDHYATIVKQQAYLRRTLGVLTDIVSFMYESPNPTTVYAEVQTKLNNLTPPQEAKGNVLEWGQSHVEYMGIQEEISRGESSDTRFMWPWESWNQRILPLQEGMLAQIAGGTGIGKTVLIEALADGWAEQGLKVAIFHYELSRTTMLHRRYARWCRLRMDRLISPFKERWEDELISKAGDRELAWPGEVHLVSMAGRHIDDTTAEMKRLHNELGIDVAIIDHAKKLHRHASPRQVAERLSELSRQADNFEQLKATSDILKIRSVVVNHFNKDGKSLGAAATGNDIAGAGDQADFVNLIVLLSRGVARKVEFDYYDEKRGVKTPVTSPGQPSRWVRANIDKNTLGPEEKFWQWMDPEFFTIYDRPYDEDEMDSDADIAMPMY